MVVVVITLQTNHYLDTVTFTCKQHIVDSLMLFLLIVFQVPGGYEIFFSNVVTLACAKLHILPLSGEFAAPPGDSTCQPAILGV